MMLTRWNPWQDLFDLQREMSDLTRRTFGSGSYAPWAESTGAATWSPAIDVFTRDGDLVVRAELPGVDPEKDVEIAVDKGVLTIRGERRQETRENGNGVVRVESAYGLFQRSVVLPEGVKVDAIRAGYEDGILEVVVPKGAELSAPKKIQITSGTKRKALSTRGSRK